jgi:hypothetical protein
VAGIIKNGLFASQGLFGGRPSLNPVFDDELFQYFAGDSKYAISPLEPGFLGAQVHDARTVRKLPNNSIGADSKDFSYFCWCKKV